MALSDVERNIYRLKLFRKNMGVSTPKYIVQKFWSEEDLCKLSEVRINNKISKQKYKIVKENIKKFMVFDWVRFISITGSVAAGNAKEEDDIDILIVVKNDRMWLYRGVLVLKLGFNSIRRVWGKRTKDKIDTNFICEERGVFFPWKNIFTLHELLFMLPVYNESYYEYILSVNADLLKSFSIRKSVENVNNRRNRFLGVFNTLAFCTQYLYMLLMRHRPNLKRLRENNKGGRIEFFPQDFQARKLKEYEKMSK